MVRPTISAESRASQFELKTLKLSEDALQALRKPLCWSRPNSSLYDYHYEIGGLYYQPMISYCIEREKGGERRKIDVPDRLMSNFDKRSYQLAPDQCDYEGFLSQMYVRRMREENKKTIHCANEMYTKSKKNTELNEITNAAQYRDKYVCQIQLQHTGNVAKKENLLKKKDTWTEEEVEMLERDRRAASMEKEDKLMMRVNRDGRYGPGFTKITKLATRELDWDPLAEFFPSKAEETISAGGHEESAEISHTGDMGKISSTTTTKRIVKTLSGDYREEIQEDKTKESFLKKDYLQAETMKDYLKLRAKEGEPIYRSSSIHEKPQFIDTGYAKALGGVKEQVKKAGAGGREIVTAKNFDFFIGDQKAENIGKCSKAAIHTNMYTALKMPDFMLVMILLTPSKMPK